MLLTITKCFHTACKEALPVLAGTLPLNLQAEMEAKRTTLRWHKKPVKFGSLVITPDDVPIPLIGGDTFKLSSYRWDDTPPECRRSKQVPALLA